MDSQACGCNIHVVFHDDHENKPTVIQQWIEQCPLHASAPLMLEALKLTIKDQNDDLNWETLDAIKKAIKAAQVKP